jgi:hypothetical protein
MSNLESLNLMLMEIAEANDGTNHGSEYVLDFLPPADSITLALNSYFSAMSTSISPPEPPEQWNIRITELTEAESHLLAAANRWFYELECSPKVDVATAELTVQEFMKYLSSVVGSAKVFEVNVYPPMWYECDWQDFAFDGESCRWLLHFGFSD